MKLIEDSNADIVCIQEFGLQLHNQLTGRSNIKALQTIIPTAICGTKSERKFSWGVAHSKFPIIKKKKVEYASAY